MAVVEADFLTPSLQVCREHRRRVFCGSSHASPSHQRVPSIADCDWTCQTIIEAPIYHVSFAENVHLVSTMTQMREVCRHSAAL